MMFLFLAKLQITLQDVVEVEEMIVPVTKIVQFFYHLGATISFMADQEDIVGK